jgi:hypothetical protein
MLSLRDDPTPESMIEVTVIGGVIEFASSFTSVEHDIKFIERIHTGPLRRRRDSTDTYKGVTRVIRRHDQYSPML